MVLLTEEQAGRVDDWARCLDCMSHGGVSSDEDDEPRGGIAEVVEKLGDLEGRIHALLIDTSLATTDGTDLSRWRYQFVANMERKVRVILAQSEVLAALALQVRLELVQAIEESRAQPQA